MISTIALNNMIMEILKEIAVSDKLSTSFKEYSLKIKPRVRKAEGGKKKKGFPTSKA